MAQEEEKWKAEVDSAETHKKRLEKKVMQGCEEAEEELKAAQQQYVSLPLSPCIFSTTCISIHAWTLHQVSPRRAGDKRGEPHGLQKSDWRLLICSKLPVCSWSMRWFFLPFTSHSFDFWDMRAEDFAEEYPIFCSLCFWNAVPRFILMLLKQKFVHTEAACKLFFLCLVEALQWSVEKVW